MRYVGKVSVNNSLEFEAEIQDVSSAEWEGAVSSPERAPEHTPDPGPARVTLLDGPRAGSVADAQVDVDDGGRLALHGRSAFTTS
jgi:hypothetical protein